MVDVLTRIVASLMCSLVFCLMTEKTLGAMQQSGYKNGVFLRWLKAKGNMTFNRLCVFALCTALATTVIALCFSFLGVKLALAISFVPFCLLSGLYLFSDRKYALKVSLIYTGRAKRLFVGYYFCVACVSYAIIAVLAFLKALNGSFIYGLVAFAPFAVTPILLPFILCFANAVLSVFENARNAKFVKRAGQVLEQKQIIRVGVVGSYGKTTVKNILTTLLSEKYRVVATPQSFNTPIGIAKTVFSDGFDDAQVLIAEMGARKAGDIDELCRLVHPDFAVFTGVCAQHISTFESEEGVLKEKSRILEHCKCVVCGESLKSLVQPSQNALFVDDSAVVGVRLGATKTQFTLRLGDEEVAVDSKLLGEMAVENILLAVTLAHKMGLTKGEIESGLKKVEQIPHRLQLIESGGTYILDDGYNCNPRGAKQAIDALCRFDGGRCVVTPGIVECGALEEDINAELGAYIAKADLEKVILVGDTLVGALKGGYLSAGGRAENIVVVPTLDDAKGVLAEWLKAGDAVLFLNDLPDVY